MMLTNAHFDVLICYRGRYRKQVESIVDRVRARNLSVTYDNTILAAGEEQSVDEEIDWLSYGNDDTAWECQLPLAPL